MGWLIRIDNIGGRIIDPVQGRSRLSSRLGPPIIDEVLGKNTSIQAEIGENSHFPID